MSKELRADMHYHAAIGFQKPWLAAQGYNRINFAKAIFEEAIRKGIGLVGITSEALNIRRGDCINDRFSRIIKDAYKIKRQEGYEIRMLGYSALVIQRAENRLIIMNNQTALTLEDGKRKDLLVMGTNRVPKDINLEDALKICNEKGYITAMEHPDSAAFYGAGDKLLEKYRDLYDLIEGHNAQLCLPDKLLKFPLIGQAVKLRNIRAQKNAEALGKPWYACSDGKTIGLLGRAYTLVPEEAIDISSAARFLGSFKENMRRGNFRVSHEGMGYANEAEWLWRNFLFQAGIRTFARKCSRD